MSPMFKNFWKSSWGETLQVLLLVVIIVFPFRIYVAQPFIVSGPSMDNTFADGQYLIVDELTYEQRDPHRGEVVIFRYPLEPSKFFIKRVIGLPNDKIEISNNVIKINGQTLTENYVKTDTTGLVRPDISVTLKANEYYVLGDNRGVSSDSRIWGPVDRKLITGRPFLRLIPFSKIALWPGQVTE